MLEAFKKLPLVTRLIISAVLAALIIWSLIGVAGRLSTSWDIWRDNAKDVQLQKQVDKLEAEKLENNKKIDILVADNGKLKAENLAKDLEIKTINDALANDGKIIKSEQVKIDEARKKYNETKNSCNNAVTPDEYVQCVCAELGVACP